ncbi:hypothetical protein JB92DRAFT_3139644 [Gautieria morchelliformis]|nr:hypothetical protein JB92DRAFT_3139644 [Gautieria morchelliformis]
MSYGPTLLPLPTDFPSQQHPHGAHHLSRHSKPPAPPLPPNFRPEDDRALDLVARMPERAMPSLGVHMARTLDDYLNYAPTDYRRPSPGPGGFAGGVSPGQYVNSAAPGYPGSFSRPPPRTSPPRQAQVPPPHPYSPQRSPDPAPRAVHAAFPAFAASLPTIETFQAALLRLGRRVSAVCVSPFSLIPPLLPAPTPSPSSATSRGSSTAPSPSTRFPVPGASRPHIELAAHLGFTPAQYKLGHVYEYVVPPCAYDLLLSVQSYRSNLKTLTPAIFGSATALPGPP